MAETHAKYSPSKLSRILACPASGQTQDSSKSSSYAEEGTLLHDVTATCLLAHQRGVSWAMTLDTLTLVHELTNEQKIAVEDCVIYALNLAGDLKDFHIETRFYVVPDCDGTADLVFYDGEVLHVVDWKFGQGIEVSAVENPQLKAYGVGSVKFYWEDAKLSQLVRMHVVQPRLKNYSTFDLTVGDLERWVQYDLIPGIAAAEQDDPEYKPSIEACRWCPRKQTCAARLTLAVKNAEAVFAEHAKMPDIPLEALQLLIPMAEQIEQVIKDLKLLAQQQLSDGKEVPGYKLVRGRSNRAWIDSEVAGEFLFDLIEVEDLMPTKMIGPAAAEKLLERAMRTDERFTALIEKPEGKITLAVESDKRPAISLNPEAVFADCVEK